MYHSNKKKREWYYLILLFIVVAPRPLKVASRGRILQNKRASLYMWTIFMLLCVCLCICQVVAKRPTQINSSLVWKETPRGWKTSQRERERAYCQWLIWWTHDFHWGSCMPRYDSITLITYGFKVENHFHQISLLPKTWFYTIFSILNSYLLRVKNETFSTFSF